MKGLTCCPRQILGPALKGRNMNGFGRRYFLNRSSRNRSGSNTRAGRHKRFKKKLLIKEPNES